jgi:hypothetical protein
MKLYPPVHLFNLDFSDRISFSASRPNFFEVANTRWMVEGTCFIMSRALFSFPPMNHQIRKQTIILLVLYSMKFDFLL